MGKICQRCGKGALTGSAISKSKVHAKRSFRPNLQQFLVKTNGRVMRTTLCSDCRSILRKLGKLK